IAAARERHERRRRGVVVIPQVVVYGLKGPYQLAGRGSQRDDRVGVAIVAEPEHTVVVGSGTPRRNEDQVPPGVRRQHGPGVGRTALWAMAPRHSLKAGSFG